MSSVKPGKAENGTRDSWQDGGNPGTVSLVYASGLFQSARRSTLFETKIARKHEVDSRSGGRRASRTRSLSVVSARRRPTIYRANISRLFFHSVSSLLFSNHRPTSIAPFIHGQRGTLASLLFQLCVVPLRVSSLRR